MILLTDLNASVNALCTSSTLKSTSSASRAVSAVAEVLVQVLTTTGKYGLVMRLVASVCLCVCPAQAVCNCTHISVFIAGWRFV